MILGDIIYLIIIFVEDRWFPGNFISSDLLLLCDSRTFDDHYSMTCRHLHVCVALMVVGVQPNEQLGFAFSVFL